ncbi:hypothetical protein FOA52_012866 [Chlamydomonas sp. UWO 241]|nr:hypothetical protein FOA52_012866 [Chlamydomonas sp. UWO 241]
MGCVSSKAEPGAAYRDAADPAAAGVGEHAKQQGQPPAPPTTDNATVLAKLPGMSSKRPETARSSSQTTIGLSSARGSDATTRASAGGQDVVSTHTSLSNMTRLGSLHRGGDGGERGSSDPPGPSPGAVSSQQVSSAFQH